MKYNAVPEKRKSHEDTRYRQNLVPLPDPNLILTAKFDYLHNLPREKNNFSYFYSNDLHLEFV